MSDQQTVVISTLRQKSSQLVLASCPSLAAVHFPSICPSTRQRENSFKIFFQSETRHEIIMRVLFNGFYHIEMNEEGRVIIAHTLLIHYKDMFALFVCDDGSEYLYF